jgi:prepilin-type processing-associated H-X9-DG protein
LSERTASRIDPAGGRERLSGVRGRYKKEVTGPDAAVRTVPTSTAPLAAGIYYSNNSYGIGGCWFLGMMVFTRYNHAMPPNFQSCDYTTSGGGLNIHGAHTASSRHPGGVDSLFCDGSVKFIKSSISQQTRWALGTTSNGEVIDASSY